MDVLLVEDNPGDIRLVREAFHAADISASLHITCDGAEAMTFLRRSYQNSTSRSYPVGLNLPKMGGREILTQIKYDKNFRMIPTIILTSSDVEMGIRYC
jgi:CheY-like chemotaxis protein